MTLRLLPAALALAAALLGAPAQGQLYTLHADIPYHAVPGVDPDLLRLDVYQPEGEGPFPVVVFVHGGGWHTGSRTDTVHEKADWLAAQGILFVSVSYRLSPSPSPQPDPDRVRFPVHPSDVGRAAAFVHAHAALWNGDPTRLALMGHSAGAHLALLVGTDPAYLAAAGASTADVACAVGLDTNALDIPFYLPLASPSQQALYVNAFTDDPALQRAASPIAYAAEARLPRLMAVHQAGALRRATAQRFADTLAASGHAVVRYEAAGYSHAALNRELGLPSPYTDAVGGFLVECFGLGVAAEAPPGRSETLGVFPNPTSGLVTLRLPESLAGWRIVVVDAAGRRVLERRTPGGETRIDLRTLAAGTYTVVARSGRRVFTGTVQRVR